MSGFWREHVTKRMERSPEWSTVRNDFIESGNDFCAACGKKASWKLGLQVHHIIPFSVNHKLELESSNLITLCDKHHLWMGHLGYFQSWNPTVVEDCELMLRKILNRPTKKKEREWSEKFWSAFFGDK